MAEMAPWPSVGTSISQLAISPIPSDRCYRLKGKTGGWCRRSLSAAKSDCWRSEKVGSPNSGDDDNVDDTLPGKSHAAVAADTIASSAVGLRRLARTRVCIQLQLQSAAVRSRHLPASDLRSRVVEPKRRHAPDAHPDCGACRRGRGSA